MTINPITPALWFRTDNGRIGEVLDYYRVIFLQNFLIEKNNENFDRLEAELQKF